MIGFWIVITCFIFILGVGGFYISYDEFKCMKRYSNNGTDDYHNKRAASHAWWARLFSAIALLCWAWPLYVPVAIVWAVCIGIRGIWDAVKEVWEGAKV